MNEFDLAYFTEDRTQSVIVERLPRDRPAVTELEGDRVVRLRYRFRGHVPPGIPGWFIARTNRFSTAQHWMNGTLLRYGDSTGLLELDRGRRLLDLSVAGRLPYYFFAVLREGLEYPLRKRYEPLLRPGSGLVERVVPCPGRPGSACREEFPLELLEEYLERGDHEVDCRYCREKKNVLELLYGISASALEQVLTSIKAERQQDRAYLQFSFLQIYQREQARSESACPSVFTIRYPRWAELRPLPADWWDWIRGTGEPLELQLYCEAPGLWHAVGAPYVIPQPADWVPKLRPHIRRLAAWMTTLGPAAAKAAGSSGHRELEVMLLLMASLARETDSEDSLEAYRPHLNLRSAPAAIRGRDLSIMCELLHTTDQGQVPPLRGLRRYVTAEGQAYWLCDEHYGHV